MTASTSKHRRGAFVWVRGAVVCVSICAGFAAAVALFYDRGAPNYDLTYALSWGAQIASGHRPSFDVPMPPTPHPLTNLYGMMLSPLGEHATDAATAAGLLALGAVGYLAFLLGRELGGPVAGAVAAVLALTRGPILFWGALDYLDIPVCALLLAAIAFEIRRPRRERAVLFALLLTGLLRPEAWLLSVGYLLLMAGRAGRVPDNAALALAGAAPVIWVLADLITTGHPLYSFTLTRDLTADFGRETGLGAVLDVPRSIARTMRPEVALGAVLGVIITWRSNRGGAVRLLALSAAATATTVAVIVAGTPLNDRYLFLAPIVGCIFCAVAVRAVFAVERVPRALGAIAVVCVAVGFVVDVPRLATGRALVREERHLVGGLHAIADQAAASRCPRVIALSRAAPWLSVWRGTPAPHFVASGTRMPPAAVITPTAGASSAQFTERNGDHLPPGRWQRAPIAWRDRFWILRVEC